MGCYIVGILVLVPMILLGWQMGGILGWLCVGVCSLLLLGCVIPLGVELTGKLYHQPRRRTIVDPVLGEVEFERSWQLRLSLKSLGGQFAVEIDAPRQTGPSKSQRRALERLVEKQAELRQVVQEAIFKVYRESYAEEDESEYRPTGPEEIWKTLQPLGMSVPDEKTRQQRGYDVLAYWNCTWDEEHGIAARFADGSFRDTCDPGEG